MEESKDTKTGAETKRIFVISPEEQYECIQCGYCCSDFWEIPVDDESVNRIEELDISRIRPSLRYNDPFRRSPIDPERRIIQQTEGRCCFVVKQHLCGLHYYFDKTAKPRVCRQFPLTYVKTPEGIYVGASFVCPAVQRNEGLLLSEQEDLISETYEKAIGTITIPEEIPLDDTITLSWTDYRKLEDGLLELLSIETMPVTLILIAGNIYLDLAADFIQEAEKSGKYSRDEVIDTYLRLMREQHFAKAFGIAENASPTPRLQRLYIGIMASFRNTITKKRSYLATIFFWLKQYFFNVVGLGSFQILPVEHRFSISDFRSIRFPLEDPFFRYTILRYIKQLVFRKQGLDKMSWKRAYRFILLYFALIRWFATALAVDTDVAEVDRLILMRAIGLVEQYYVRHLAMDAFFLEHPHLDSLLQSFMENKRYASTMVLPPVSD